VGHQIATWRHSKRKEGKTRHSFQLLWQVGRSEMREFFKTKNNPPPGVVLMLEALSFWIGMLFAVAWSLVRWEAARSVFCCVGSSVLSGPYFLSGCSRRCGSVCSCFLSD
jgi:hypothetical protein